MAKYKILYTDTGIGDVSIEERVLKEGSAELVLASNTDEETLIKEGSDCDGVMVEYAQITAKVLDAWKKAGKVKVVSRQGIGVDMIDVEAATRNGIMVANVPDYCLNEVADHTMALALGVLRELKSFGRRMESGDFEEHAVGCIHRLSALNYCLYGFGSIAKRVAVRAKAFGFTLYAYDPAVSDEEFKKYHVERKDSLLELAASADVFSVHVPLTEKTRHSVNAEVFKALPDNCVFVNTARGAVVDEEAFMDCLCSGKLAGAGLDVFSKEPLDVNSPLLNMHNVITSPHMSWYSEEADIELRQRVAENVLLALTKGAPRGFVNRDSWSK